ncbi:MAG TPA: 3' terminal RNA ribose 2'-O-methyltransferase Hen1, partial [Ktedonobacterales bacterium]|nr:3' terminal RNA ribose 2'-O-methyltransferase Hen1 [Ktedonobacterales bacterium]
MLITLSCRTPNAPDIGYLLAKNPTSVFVREISAGKVWVFYPEASDERITVAMLTEIDVVGLVRGPASFSRLDQYVNDRPYVASSLTSVAIHTAFSTALAGHNTQRPERMNERFAWEVQIPSVACDGGEDLITRVFAPLGYAVTTTRLPLDMRFPAWGQADLYSLTLQGAQTVKDVLNHLYVLLPVLDNSKHYYVGAEETGKLLSHGGGWLAAHPERKLITRRYLRYKRPLVESALDRLAASAPELTEALEDDITAEEDIAAETETADQPQAEEPAPEPEVPAIGLHRQRLQAAIEAVRACDAHSLLDLGCGEGRLLEMALNERQLKRILGIDVSSVALARARKRLHLDTLPPAKRERIQIEQGSLLYRDRRLAG